jgi:hypothetical protein
MPLLKLSFQSLSDKWGTKTNLFWMRCPGRASDRQGRIPGHCRPRGESDLLARLTSARKPSSRASELTPSGAALSLRVGIPKPSRPNQERWEK